MTEKVKEIKETLETWRGGVKANGYYEPFTNEIHVLRGADLEFRTLMHERIHASRRHKKTAIFAALLGIPQIINLLFGLLIVLGIIGIFSSLAPFLVVAAMFASLQTCVIYEEAIADKLTNQAMKEIKTNGN